MKWILPLVIVGAVLAGGLIFWVGQRSGQACHLPADEVLTHPDLLRQFKADSPVPDEFRVRAVEFSHFLNELYLEVSEYENSGSKQIHDDFAGDSATLQRFRAWVAKNISQGSAAERSKLIAIMKQILILQLNDQANRGEESRKLFEIRLKRMNSLFEKESAALARFFCLD